ncbi:MAG: NUDIX domain-containing protein [Actinomycetota bacterium]
MAALSCGILLHRSGAGGVEVFLGHMGGPFWAKKDAGAWSVPKGAPLEGESELKAALREFDEEIGRPAPAAEYSRLGEFRQRSGKVVIVFGAATTDDVRFVASNSFELEWPPRSGKLESFPEIDRAEWMPLAAAAERMVAGQRAMLDALATAG